MHRLFFLLITPSLLVVPLEEECFTFTVKLDKDRSIGVAWRREKEEAVLSWEVVQDECPEPEPSESLEEKYRAREADAQWAMQRALSDPDNVVPWVYHRELARNTRFSVQQRPPTVRRRSRYSATLTAGESVEMDERNEEDNVRATLVCVEQNPNQQEAVVQTTETTTVPSPPDVLVPPLVYTTGYGTKHYRLCVTDTLRRTEQSVTPVRPDGTHPTRPYKHLASNARLGLYCFNVSNGELLLFDSITLRYLFICIPRDELLLSYCPRAFVHHNRMHVLSGSRCFRFNLPMPQWRHSWTAEELTLEPFHLGGSGSGSEGERESGATLVSFEGMVVALGGFETNVRIVMEGSTSASVSLPCLPQRAFMPLAFATGTGKLVVVMEKHGDRSTRVLWQLLCHPQEGKKEWVQVCEIGCKTLKYDCYACQGDSIFIATCGREYTRIDLISGECRQVPF